MKKAKRVARAGKSAARKKSASKKSASSMSSRDRELVYAARELVGHAVISLNKFDERVDRLTVAVEQIAMYFADVATKDRVQRLLAANANSSTAEVQ